MTADPSDRCKAMKLAYMYQTNGMARDGMPAATYFLASETAWALVEFQGITTVCRLFLFGLRAEWVFTCD